VAKKRVAILISGRGSNMEALITAAAAQDYPAQVALVVSNKADAMGVERAAAAGVETEIVDQRLYRGARDQFEQKLLASLRQRQVDLICLAGFMRVLSTAFVEQWQNRLLNVHPALLPAFKGIGTHARALAAGVKIHGATVHLVVPEVDSGPILVQAALAVQQGDTVETLAARVLALEHRIYPAALRMVAEERVHIVDGRCRIDGQYEPECALIAPEI
jgi:phosphoribosylglycinamide formyltransferase 1